MKNYALLAGAAFMLLGMPAFAQDAPAPDAGVAADSMPMPAAPDATTMPAPDAGMTPAPDAGMTPAPDATTMPAPGAGATGAPSTDAGMTTPPADAGMTTATTGAAAPADPAKAAAAEQMISQNWAKYDPDNKGALTPLQFGAWVMAAQGQDMSAQIDKTRTSRAAGLPATKVLNATAGEFSRADTNGDRTISREELKAYLSA